MRIGVTGIRTDTRMKFCQKQKETNLGKYDSYCNKEEGHSDIQANHKTSRHIYKDYMWWLNKGLTTENGRLVKVKELESS